MTPKFYIQSGYDGKEVGALRFSYEREDLVFSAISEYQEGMIPVGTVEFVEQYIGQRKPDYYPDFLKNYFGRDIWYSENFPQKQCFIKPADRHKRFDAKVVCPTEACLRWVKEYLRGPYWCSDIVGFTDEWRYYVANGQILAAYWYLGEENEVDPPDLSHVSFPSSFCGAVDFGRLNNGEIALVENNLPYGCGWYGPYSEGRVYGEWLREGFKYLQQ